VFKGLMLKRVTNRVVYRLMK